MPRAALLLALLLAGCAAPGASLDGSSPPDALAQPFVRDAIQIDTRWSGEPSVLALADGTLLVTGAGGLSRYAEDPMEIVGNFGQSYLWRSEDDGASWSFVDLGLPAPLASLLPYRNAIAGVEGDLAQDEAGRAYFVDLAALAGSGLSASDDGGRTWTAAQNPLVGLPGQDRPWVAAYGDGVVYVKYLQQGGHRVARSTDGGVTFLDDVSIRGCGQGPLVADVAAREMLVACADERELSILRAPEGPMVWETVDVPDAAGGTHHIFVSLAVARSGQYVFAWSERTETGASVRIAASADRGATWTAPVNMSPPGRTAVFPWVDANAAGVVGVVWYEADADGPPDAIDASWSPKHARLHLDAAGALSAPSISTLTATPVHEGAICTDGLGCVLTGRSEERRLLDFFEVDVDAAGRSHVAWTNTRTDVPTVWYGRVD